MAAPQDVEAEIALQQTDAFDPASRVKPGQMITPTIMVTGSTHFENDAATYTVEMRNHVDGSLIRTVTGSLPEADFREVGASIAAEVLDEAYRRWAASGGTVGGGADVKITGDVGRLESPFELSGHSRAARPSLRTYLRRPAAETSLIRARAPASPDRGTGTYTMSRQPDGTVRIDQTATGCIHGLPNS